MFRMVSAIALALSLSLAGARAADIMVTSSADSGAGSLRQAIADVSAGGSIDFAVGLNGSTITLTSEIMLNKGVSIDATSLSNGLKISGGNTDRVFSVDASGNLTLRCLTLSGGNGVGAASSGSGGAIYNAGTVTLERCTLSGNTATQNGGAILNASSATLIISNSTLSVNSSSTNGGAIANFGSVTLDSATLSGNTVSMSGSGGGIYNPVPASLTLNNSIVAGNNPASCLNIAGIWSGNNNLTSGSPMLTALSDTGGPTFTMPPLAGSPAIDAGGATTLMIDQRGLARVLEVGLDIGACEIQATALPTGVTNGLTIYFSPTGLAIYGSLAVANSDGVFEISTDSLFRPSVTTYAGMTPEGFADGARLSAQFRNPSGVAQDSEGNIFIADSSNHSIRMINAIDGTVSIIAGSGDASVPGLASGTGPNARFAFPTGLAVDVDDNVYVADTYNHRICKLTRPASLGGDWTVTSLAGPSAVTPPALINGSSSSARFSYPYGLAVDADLNVYVADAGNHCIRKIKTSGSVSVSTYAGTGNSGNTNNPSALSASFNTPRGLAFAGTELPNCNTTISSPIVTCANTSGLVVGMSISGTNIVPGTTILSIDPNVSFVLSEDAVGTAGLVTLYYPSTILYVADTGNNCIRKILPDGINAGAVSTIAGSTISSSGYNDATGAAALFNTPSGLASDGKGRLYVADENNHRIREVGISTLAVTTVAGTTVTTPLALPNCVTTNSSTTVTCPSTSGLSVGMFITGTNIPVGTEIFRINDGTSFEISNAAVGAGTVTLSHSSKVDGLSSVAQFNSPTGLLVGLDGNLVVADSSNHVIRHIDIKPLSVRYSVISGWGGGSDVLVNAVLDMASLGLNPGGTYYFRWKSASATQTGVYPPVVLYDFPVVVTSAADNITPTAARLNASVNPNSSATVVEFEYSTDPDLLNPYEVKAFAGTGVAGFVDNVTLELAQFSNPSGVVTDACGDVYIADRLNHRIRKMTSTGVVTFAGSGAAGFANGTGAAAVFERPSGIAIDSNGNFYVADEFNHCIRMITPAGEVSTFAGIPQNAGFVDGDSLAAAKFRFPRGVAVDSANNVYVADTGNHRIRRIDAVSGVVTTLAGTGGAAFADGAAATASLSSPLALAVTSDGKVLVADTGNHRIRMIDSGLVSTIAGAGNAGFLDGAGSSAQFSSPAGIALDALGVAYITDEGNHLIRRIGTDTNRTVTTFAGSGIDGTVNSPAIVSGLEPTTACQFSSPSAIGIDTTGSLFVTQEGLVRKISRSASLPSVTGTPNPATGSVAIPVSAMIPQSLRYGTTYYFRAKGTNARGLTTGDIFSFVTTEAKILVYDGDSVSDPAILHDQATELDFGITPRAKPVTRTFTISNPGTSALTVTSIDVPSSGYILTSGIVNPIPALGSATFQVSLTAAAGTATYTGDIVINCNAHEQAVFSFPITGIVLNPPIVTTNPVSDTDIGTATFYATVNPEGSDTTVWFEWSVDENFDGVYVTTAAGSGDGYAEGVGIAAKFDQPSGVATDANGNIFIADTENHRIRRIDATTKEVTTFAGSGVAGYVNGAGAIAQFNEPVGLAINADGVLFVADSQNHIIRAINALGEVSNYSGAGDAITLSGCATTSGGATVTCASTSAAVVGMYLSGTNIPVGTKILSITSPTAFVIDKPATATGSGLSFNAVRIYGSFTNGDAMAARFHTPLGLAIDGDGVLYVADSVNHRIRKVETDGSVSTLSGTGVAGYLNDLVNDSVTVAQFTNPAGIAVDSTGLVYVTEAATHAIRKVAPNGVTDDYVGSRGTAGFGNGTGASALFSSPAGLVVGLYDRLYVADTGNNRIRIVETNGDVITIAGTAAAAATVDGYGDTPNTNHPLGMGAPTAVLAQFSSPISIAATASGVLIVGESGGSAIREISSLQHIVQAGPVPSGTADVSVQLEVNGLPTGLMTYFYRAVASNGGGTTTDDSPRQSALVYESPIVVTQPATNLTPTSARLNAQVNPKLSETAVVFEYSTDPGLLKPYEVKAFAGTGVAGFVDNADPALAQFSNPSGVVTDASGNIFVADRENHVIRKITPAGVVSTFAGSGVAGFADGAGLAAQFEFPSGIAIDSKDNLYVADELNHCIRMITPAGLVSSFAGTAQDAGLVDGPKSSAQFNYPKGVAVDASDNVYVADKDNNRIRKIAGIVTLSNCVTIASSTTVTCSSTAGLTVGMAIYGPNIAPGTIIDSIHPTDGKSFVISLPALVTSTLTTFNVGDEVVLPYCVTTNLSTTVTRESTSGLVVGMSVTGTNIAPGTTIVSIVLNTSFELSQAAVGSGAVSLNFVSQLELPNCVTTNSSTTVACTNTSGLVVGMSINGANIPLGTTIVSIVPNTSFVLSQAAVGSSALPSISAGDVVVTTIGGDVSGDFSSPEALVVSSDGKVLVADTGSHRIRLIDSGVVSTLAGSGTEGFLDAAGATAKFSSPTGITLDAAGVAYVTDAGNHRIRRIATDGAVTTLAGSGLVGNVNSPVSGLYPATTTRFDAPAGICGDGLGGLIVTQEGLVRKIARRATLPTLTWSPNLTGSVLQSVYANIVEPLRYGSTYYFRAVASNGRGTTTGAILSFVTLEAKILVFDGDSVSDPAILHDQATVLDFGNTPTGQTVTRSFTISNPGTFDLTVSSIDSLSEYSITPDVISIPALGSATFQVTLTALDAGTDSGDVVITSNVHDVPDLLPGEFYFSFPITGLVYDPAVVTTLAVSDTDNGTATFNATVNPRGSNTTVWFEWSIDENFDGVYVSTVAGSGPGYVNDIGVAAKFDQPSGLVTDAAGNTYVADKLNHRIRKIAPDGTTTTFAGGNGEFNEPVGLAMNASGTLFVADSKNHRIRAITAAGAVSTYCGTGVAAFTDGLAGAARFDTPLGLAIDGAGMLYVADSGNHRIRKVALNGSVSTLSGTGVAGYLNDLVDDSVTVAQFTNPVGIAVDSLGNVYVTESASHAIRKVAASGVTSDYVGSRITSGIADLNGSAARFSSPTGLVVGLNNRLYVADTGNQRIRIVETNRDVITIAGTAAAATVDGYGDVPNSTIHPLATPVTIAQFNSPISLATTAGGGVVVGQASDSIIRKILPIQVLLSAPPVIDGTSTLPVELLVNGLPTGLTTYFYRAIATNGGGTTIGNSLESVVVYEYPVVVTEDATDLTPTSARLNATVDPKLSSTTVVFEYSTDPGLLNPYEVSAIAGAVTPGYADNAIPANARFSNPSGSVTDGSGNIFVVDRANHRIRKITPAGVVSTFAGGGLDAPFEFPSGIAIDSKGNLYVADEFNHCIRMIPTVGVSAGVVSTFAGINEDAGLLDGASSSAKFHYPRGVAVDASDNVYVADKDNHRIRKIAGTVTLSNCATTIASTTVRCSSTLGLTAGMVIYSPNIPLGTTVASVTNSTSFELSANAVATSTLTTFNVGNVVVLPNCVTTNSSTTVTCFNTSGLITGMSVTGANIAPGTTIASIPNSTSFVLNKTALGSAPVSLTFVPQLELPNCVTTNASTTVTCTNTSGLVGGMSINGPNIAPGTTILSIVPNTSFVLSQAAVGTSTLPTINAGAMVVTTLAGSDVPSALNDSGFADGPVATSLFNSPGALVVTSEGKILVADTGNHRIRMIHAGVVSTLAGSGTFGFLDGPGASAQFASPTGIALDAAGVAYVTDAGNHRIRRIATDGAVTTIAGSGLPGNVNSPLSGLYPATTTRFDAPSGISADGTGGFIVTQEGLVRKIARRATLPTLTVVLNPTGPGEQSVYADITEPLLYGSTYYFRAVGTNGRGTTTGDILSFVTREAEILVFDGNSVSDPAILHDQATAVDFIYTPTGQPLTRTFTISNPGTWPLDVSNVTVTVPAGYQLTGGVAIIPPLGSATFQVTLSAITANTYSGDVVITSDAHEVPDLLPGEFYFSFPITGRVLDPPVITTLSQTNVSSGAATFNATVNPRDSSTTVWFEWSLDSEFDGFRVTTVAGSGNGYTEGVGVAAQFNQPSGLVSDAAGNIYVADTLNHRIRKIATNGTTTTFAGGNGEFNEPVGLALNATTGVLYVADSKNHRIRAITAGGVVSTYCGTGVPQFTDGEATAAEFNKPLGLAIDGAGVLYVADSENHRIRKVATNGDVSTLSGPLVGTGDPGYVNGPGVDARFTNPVGIAVDSLGNVYVTEAASHAIRKVAANGDTEDFVGSRGTPGFVEATGAAARFTNPVGLVVDANDQLYVADSGNHRVRIVESDGFVDTVAGTDTVGAIDGYGHVPQYVDPVPANPLRVVAQLSTPISLATAAGGAVIFGEASSYSTIRKITSLQVVLQAATGLNGTTNQAVNLAVTGLPPTGTTYFYRSYATNLGGTTIANAMASRVVTFRAWQLNNFGLNASNPLISGPTASPSGDGVSNILKYASGLNPLVRVTSPVPDVKFTGGRIQLEYTKITARTDAVYTVQWSTDLVNWSTANILNSQVDSNNTLGDNNFIRTRSSVAMTPEPAKFMRLVVTFQTVAH